MKYVTISLVVDLSLLTSKKETIYNSCSLRTVITPAPHSLSRGTLAFTRGMTSAVRSASLPARQVDSAASAVGQFSSSV